MTDFEIIEFLKFAFCYDISCQDCMMVNMGGICSDKIRRLLLKSPDIIVSRIKSERNRMKIAAIKRKIKNHETVVGSKNVCKMFLGWAE